MVLCMFPTVYCCEKPALLPIVVCRPELWCDNENTYKIQRIWNAIHQSWTPWDSPELAIKKPWHRQRRNRSPPTARPCDCGKGSVAISVQIAKVFSLEMSTWKLLRERMWQMYRQQQYTHLIPSYMQVPLISKSVGHRTWNRQSQLMAKKPQVSPDAKLWSLGGLNHSLVIGFPALMQCVLQFCTRWTLMAMGTLQSYSNTKLCITFGE